MDNATVLVASVLAGGRSAITEPVREREREREIVCSVCLCVHILCQWPLVHRQLLIERSGAAFSRVSPLCSVNHIPDSGVTICRHEVANRVRSRTSIELHGGKIGHAQ